MSFARIRFAGDSVLMKPIKPVKEGSSFEDVVSDMEVNNVTNFHSKKYKNVFQKGTGRSRSVCPLGKWYLYEDDFGLVNVDMLNDYQLGEYLIDSKSDLHKEIDKIHNQDGFKFQHVSDLRKHCICELKLKYKKRYSLGVLDGAVTYYFEKKWKSFQERSKRFLDKAFCNQDSWTHFVTFTYNSELLSEAEFFEKLKKWLARQTAEGIKYQGIFERSDTGRLHFHCLFSSTEDFTEKMEINEETYFDKKHGQQKTTYISSKLLKKFGRCEFSPLNACDDNFQFLLKYLCKYILKQDNKIVYSRGLKQEAICEVEDFINKEIGVLTSSSTFSLMEKDVDYRLCQFMPTYIGE